MSTFRLESWTLPAANLGPENPLPVIHKAADIHANVKVDQYVSRGEMRPGRNVILLKICQNEQVADWTVDWKFQLRVCDATGTAILSLDRPPTATAASKTPTDKTAANGAAAK